MAKLGQHFMIDGKVLGKVVEYSGLETGDRVLEIGPGHGELTQLLAERCSVTAIEADKELFKEISGKFGNAKIINADAIKAKWPPFDKCVSNLPYAISKRFILKLLQHDFELAVIVVQKEFAEKLAAMPGDDDYGAVSVCAQSCCDVELLDRVPKNAFKPQPKVESQIVRLRQKEVLQKGFLGSVTKLFQNRNKKIGSKRVRELSVSEIKSMYDGKNL